MYYRIVFYCIVSYCVVLYCIVLCCIVFYCIVCLKHEIFKVKRRVSGVSLPVVQKIEACLLDGDCLGGIIGKFELKEYKKLKS